MPRPGVDVLIMDDAPPGGPQFQTGRAFFVGNTQRGPVAPTELTSLGQYEANYGGRAGYATLYDSVAAFFTEGGASLIFARATGDDATPATAEFGGLTADASSAGTWGNAVTVRAIEPATMMETAMAAALAPTGNGGGESVPTGTIEEVLAWVGSDPDRAQAALDAENASGSPRSTLVEQLEPIAAAGGGMSTFAAGDPVVIVVAENGQDVERSTPVVTAQEAMDWAAARSRRIVFTGEPDAALPAAGEAAATLAGGADAPYDAAGLTAALGRLNYGYGPGQVCVPGDTELTTYDAVAAHCEEMQRVGIVDLPNTADVLELGAAVGSLYGKTGARYVMAVAPWANYPVRNVAQAVSAVPYSAVQAGMIARVDAQGNPAMPAAGASGISTAALGLTHSYTQDEATALNDMGVVLAREMYGGVRTYGYRTAAGPAETNWLFFGESRTVMAVAHEAAIAAENYLFRPIDGRGHILGELAKDLVGICARYYGLGALYGATDNDAYRVDVGPMVNTRDSINRGEIHAVLKLKTSRDAEWVVVSITKVPLDRAL